MEYGKWQLEANNRSIKSCQQVDEIHGILSVETTKHNRGLETAGISREVSPAKLLQLRLVSLVSVRRWVGSMETQQLKPWDWLKDVEGFD